MQQLKAVGKLSGPLYLLLVALTYILGAGIARYLGFPVRAAGLGLGLFIVLVLQASMGWLAAVFLPLHERLLEQETPAERLQVRTAVLYTVIAALAVAAVAAFTLSQSQAVSAATAVCLSLSLFVTVAYALPPMRAVDRGLAEVLTATQVAFLAPTIGFLLQADAPHWLVNLCALALSFLLVATLIALQLPSYAEDARLDRVTILTRMGWEGALTIHHVLILTPYLLLAYSILLGLSFSLIGPAFLTLPFALLQVLLLHGIVRGARPIWNLLRANALAVFSLTSYFLALSFWLR